MWLDATVILDTIRHCRQSAECRQTQDDFACRLNTRITTSRPEIFRASHANRIECDAIYSKSTAATQLGMFNVQRSRRSPYHWNHICSPFIPFRGLFASELKFSSFSSGRGRPSSRIYRWMIYRAHGFDSDLVLIGTNACVAKHWTVSTGKSILKKTKCELRAKNSETDPIKINGIIIVRWVDRVFHLIFRIHTKWDVTFPFKCRVRTRLTAANNFRFFFVSRPKINWKRFRLRPTQTRMQNVHFPRNKIVCDSDKWIRQP